MVLPNYMVLSVYMGITACMSLHSQGILNQKSLSNLQAVISSQLADKAIASATYIFAIL